MARSRIGVVSGAYTRWTTANRSPASALSPKAYEPLTILTL